MRTTTSRSRKFYPRQFSRTRGLLYQQRARRNDGGLARAGVVDGLECKLGECEGRDERRVGGGTRDSMRRRARWMGAGAIAWPKRRWDCVLWWITDAASPLPVGCPTSTTPLHSPERGPPNLEATLACCAGHGRKPCAGRQAAGTMEPSWNGGVVRQVLPLRPA